MGGTGIKMVRGRQTVSLSATVLLEYGASSVESTSLMSLATATPLSSLHQTRRSISRKPDLHDFQHDDFVVYADF
jgi:hypothetical protein